MVDLGLKSFPMAIIATYSVASSVNPPPIQMLCIWIGLWVASQRFEEVEGTLNNHKQSQRVFPEYVGEYSCAFAGSRERDGSFDRTQNFNPNPNANANPITPTPTPLPQPQPQP